MKNVFQYFIGASMASATTALYHSEDDVKLTIGGIQYLLVASQKDYLAELTACVNSFLPVFVYTVAPGDRITKASLQKRIDACSAIDDVFNLSFLEHIVFFGSSKDKVSLDKDAVEFLNSEKFGAWTFIQDDGSASALAAGPYVVGRNMTWQPWRIYTDTYDTLMTSFRPGYTSTSGAVEYGSADKGAPLSAVVPSRCYFSKSDEKPLDGMRIVVKDIFDIAGTKNTLNSKAWRDLYPAKSENAPIVQSLLDKGAIIVGKTKLNAMIVREETMECVDYLAPFNPRGDGYQTSSGSSSGSCAALGAYDWVDFAIGSDTNGSCRKPAHWNGVFAIRPTHGVLSTKGVVSFCPMFDVPAFFSRDLSKFPLFAEQWYGNSDLLTRKAKAPNAILYPRDYLPTINAAQTEVIDSFVKDLENELGIARTEISLAEEWKKSRPASVQESDVNEYLKEAGTLPYYKESYELLAEFRDGYKEKFHKTPFVHRALRWRWDVAKNVTGEQSAELLERLSIYKAWVLEHIFKAKVGGGVLIVLPIENGEPNYRDAIPPPFGLLSGFSPLYLSTIAGTPEITAPVGEISYESRISNRKEPMPISVSIASAPGTDLQLIDVVLRAMKRGDKPVKLSTGRSIYPDQQPS